MRLSPGLIGIAAIVHLDERDALGQVVQDVFVLIIVDGHHLDEGNALHLFKEGPNSLRVRVNRSAAGAGFCIARL